MGGAAAPAVVVVIVGRRFLINEDSLFSTFLILKSTASFSFVNKSPFVFESGSNEKKMLNCREQTGHRIKFVSFSCIKSIMSRVY